MNEDIEGLVNPHSRPQEGAHFPGNVVHILVIKTPFKHKTCTGPDFLFDQFGDNQSAAFQFCQRGTVIRCGNAPPIFLSCGVKGAVGKFHQQTLNTSSIVVNPLRTLSIPSSRRTRK